jgi:O-antigen ligase
VNFTVVWLVVCNNQRRFVFYGIGLAVGTILSFYIHPSSEQLQSPWKFALGIPITMLIVMLVARARKHRYIGILLPLTALAVVHAFEDFRILAAISFISAIYSLFLMSEMREKFGHFRLAALALTIACGIGGFSLIYSHYAQLGVFGEYAQRKLKAQSGEGGLLLGGRSEMLASGQAIIDSPLLGHGSWARDPAYVAIMADRRAELGYKRFQGGGRSDDLIPTHSYILGAWVEAGIVGGLFWLLMLGITFSALFNASGTEPLLPLFAFAGFMLMWDILFSPLGTPTRFIAPYFMAAMISLRTFETAPHTLGWKV